MSTLPEILGVARQLSISDFFRLVEDYARRAVAFQYV